ncbi:MAG TPA: DUF2868 domain-containing protein [Prosthecobacter sp.]|nr:DUF2868 domain-containing protein [Prosthecobacter sp.]
MDWNNWLRILRWRALEEGDADGALLNEERRREATARTRGGLTSDDIEESTRLSAREMTFLDKRADWLEHEVIGWSGSVVRLMERLTVAHGRWWWALAGWAGALVAGYSVSGLGQEAEFNLLALPLVGVLLWNAVVMLAAVLWELKPAAKGRRVSTFMRWLEKLTTANERETPSEGEALTGVTVEQRFSMLAGPLAEERLHRRLRASLHVAAALLALGSALGLYGRGWAREYRAVWESTLLTEGQAQKFFGGLFAPASRLLKLEVPLAEVPRMHRTGGQTEAPAPALPWIHLYAGTLLLLVAAPRMVLAGLTLYRGRRLVNQRARGLAWRPYLVRTLRAVEGGHEKVTVLVHATDATPTHLDVWTRGVRERFGALVDPEITHVPLGDEDDFVATWSPPTARVIIIFNLATTPEAEVQRRFVADVRQALLARQRDAELIVLLDATSIGNRWAPNKVASREALWTEMMQGLADEIIIAARKGAEASSSLPA